jgi:molecular chaperone DnaJ
VVSGGCPARNNGSVARDLYEVIGTPRDADAEAIKQAYRALARELHPDMSPGDEDAGRFREATEAYAVLSDEESRRLYDRLGWRGRGGGIAPQRGVARVYTSNPRAFFEDLEAVIGAAMGRSPRREPTRVVGEVELDAYEAHIGASRDLEIAETGLCSACDGAGRRKVMSQLPAGRFLSLEDCPDCGGAGEVPKARPRTVTVPPRTRDLDRVPAGAEAVAIVRIVPPREKVAIRLAATVAFFAAIGFLLFLLAL